MKNAKIILMAGLFSLAASTCFAADPNVDAPVEGAAVVAPGTGCKACAANTKGGTLLDNDAKKDPHTQELPNGGAVPSDKAGTADKGTN